MTRTWICCPTCGSPLGLSRVGRVGVPNSRLGKRVHTPDSNVIRCEYCKTIFRSGGETLSEALGGVEE